MTEHRPHIPGIGHGRHDYLPAAGHDALLPCYDLLTRALGMGRAYDALIRQAELEDGQQLLEIGCSTGNVIIRAGRRHPGIDAVGADPDPRALTRARRKARGLPGIRFDRGYAQDLPYADGQFDRVLSSMMWHHLDDEVKPQAAAEIFRVLLPGGRLHLLDVGGPMSAGDGRAARADASETQRGAGRSASVKMASSAVHWPAAMRAAPLNYGGLHVHVDHPTCLPAAP